MRSFKLFLWFVIAFSLTVLSGMASAADTYWQASFQSVYGWGSSGQAACEAAAARYKASSSTNTAIFTRVKPLGSEFQCVGKLDANAANEYVLGGASFYTCPSTRPSYDGDGKCIVKVPVDPPIVCIPGETVDVTYKQGPVGAPAGSGYFPLWPNEPHDGQCNLNCTDGKSQLKTCFERAGNNFCTWTCEKTGNVKSSNTDANAPAAPKEATEPRKDIEPFSPKRGDCPKGTVQIGISDVGTPQCLGTGTDPKNAPPAPPKVESEKNETLPDGSVKNTKTVTTTNTDLSKTTITTVTITKSNGEKETNQAKKTTDTPAGKPGAETPPESSFCKQNPNLAVCKNSSVSGKCAETTCTGDAIQCATLRVAAVMQCKAEKDEEALKASPLAAKGQSAIDGKDLEGLPGPKNGLRVNLPGMKSEGWLGNGAAFEDVSVSLRGQEILIPLSKWSSYLLPFRYMLMIIASFISYRILAGAVLKE